MDTVYTKDRGLTTGDPPERGYRGVGVVRPIEAAKELVRVEDLAERLTGPGEGRGREIAFICPLHDDHDPSLRVDPEGRRWYCFPCGVGGDVVRLAQLAWDHPQDGRGAAEAAAYLLLEFGYELPQRPASWFDKRSRQRPIRDVIEEARVEVHMRRLWRYVVAPILADLEDADEREEMADRLWSLLRFRVEQGRTHG